MNQEYVHTCSCYDTPRVSPQAGFFAIEHSIMRT